MATGEMPRSARADPRGEGFLADVCEAWEAEAIKAQDLGLRVVRLRFGIVLATGGGAMSLMAPIFKAGLGRQPRQRPSSGSRGSTSTMQPPCSFARL